jgi:hypothetical protein
LNQRYIVAPVADAVNVTDVEGQLFVVLPLIDAVPVALAFTVAEFDFQPLVHPDRVACTYAYLVPVVEVETVQPLPEEEVQLSHWSEAEP